MTVIVGLETNDKEKAVVIGTDRMVINGELLITQFLRYIESDCPSDVNSCFKFLRKRGVDKVKFELGRKIEISEKRKIMLSHTGVKNDSHEQVRKLLLEPEEFLKQDSFLMELLFPLGCPKEQRDLILESYKELFNLDHRLSVRYIPEIRRIFDLSAVRFHDINCGFFRIAYWDRNYNVGLSEYLFAKLFGDKDLPTLFDVALTGSVMPRQYCAKGCGAKYALEYMRKRLGTQEGKFFYSTESKIEKSICSEEAVDIVKGAINYTNKRSDFCDGLDYAILTRDRIEENFSNEEKTHEIDLVSLIDRRLKNLKIESQQLKRIRQKYQQTN